MSSFPFKATSSIQEMLAENNFLISLPCTVNVAEDDTVPRKLIASHVYNPLSCDVTSTIIRPSRD